MGKDRREEGQVAELRDSEDERLAFSLRLLEWESYEMDEKGRLLSQLSPQERESAKLMVKYSNEWIDYRASIVCLGEDLFHVDGSLYLPDLEELVGSLAELVDGRKKKLDFEPIEPDFRLFISREVDQWVDKSVLYHPFRGGEAEGEVFEVYAEIDLGGATRQPYTGTGPGVRFLASKDDIEKFRAGLEREKEELERPPEELIEN
jgi:hypothetical protein